MLGVLGYARMFYVRMVLTRTLSTSGTGTSEQGRGARTSHSARAVIRVRIHPLDLLLFVTHTVSTPVGYR
jgi:hypothetical protein